MARNSKPTGSSRSQKKSKGGTLVGIFVGLVLGILIALAVVWYMNRTPAPFTDRAQNGSASAAKPGAPATPGAPNGKAAEGGEKRFQFYEILPGKAEPQPGKGPEKAAEKPPVPADKAAEKPAPGKPAEPVKAAADLYLQAGSFQNAKDAENLKASLALMGQEASVQQVMLADKVWYRVRLGPFASNDAAGKTKAELAKSGIEASLVKGKE
jgi:cell division protein FtsN